MRNRISRDDIDFFSKQECAEKHFERLQTVVKLRITLLKELRGTLQKNSTWNDVETNRVMQGLASDFGELIAEERESHNLISDAIEIIQNKQDHEKYNLISEAIDVFYDKQGL